jgi:hypothetical protein
LSIPLGSLDLLKALTTGDCIVTTTEEEVVEVEESVEDCEEEEDVKELERLAELVERLLERLLDELFTEELLELDDDELVVGIGDKLEEIKETKELNELFWLELRLLLVVEELERVDEEVLLLVELSELEEMVEELLDVVVLAEDIVVGTGDRLEDKVELVRDDIVDVKLVEEDWVEVEEVTWLEELEVELDTEEELLGTRLEESNEVELELLWEDELEEEEDELETMVEFIANIPLIWYVSGILSDTTTFEPKAGTVTEVITFWSRSL